MFNALEMFALMSCPKSRKPVASLAKRDMAVSGALKRVSVVREIVSLKCYFHFFRELPKKDFQ